MGYNYQTEYEQLDNTFILILRKLEQGTIDCEIKFKNYDNFKNFINFIESSKELRFLYEIPFEGNKKEKYYKNIELKNMTKGYIIDEDEYLIENVTFDCLSLWYEENRIIYTIEPQANEIRWDFEWDSRFADYNTRNLQYINKGHVEAPIVLEIDGYIKNPKIELYVEGQLYQTVPFNVIIQQYEKLLYDTRENNFFIGKQNTDGTKSDLFNLDVIDFENDNVLRIPKNKSCEIKLIADNDIQNAQLTILPQYKAV